MGESPAARPSGRGEMARKRAAFLMASILLATGGESAVPRVHRPLAGVTKATVSIHLELNDPLPPILLERDLRKLIEEGLRLRHVGVRILSPEAAHREPVWPAALD